MRRARGAAGLSFRLAPSMLAACVSTAQILPHPSGKSMAWVDDRIYAHPKVLTVSKAARWSYVAGIAYSAGWGTRGVLNAGALLAIGCSRRERDDLVAAGLWIPDGDVLRIKDWNEHNGKRDDRRDADRERKRKARLSAGQGADNVRTIRGHAAENQDGGAR